MKKENEVGRREVQLLDKGSTEGGVRQATRATRPARGDEMSSQHLP